MRLWHQDLIPKLPRQQLLGQHRECCALRGKGWGRKHSTVDYVFKHPIEALVAYHIVVIREMKKRGYCGYNVDWLEVQHRGFKLTPDFKICPFKTLGYYNKDLIYKEHNDSYLKECLDNLHNKGIKL